MKNAAPSKAEEILNLDYTEKDKIWLTEQDSLRIVIGILGMVLPVLLVALLLVYTGYNCPLESISHYFYTRVGSVFVIVVSLLAIFLLVYKGKKLIDFIFSSTAGIFALCVIMFPTDNISGDAIKYSVTNLEASGPRVSFHFMSAAIFLSCLAYMSLFLFTKSDTAPELRPLGKKRRNRTFRTCGVIMVLAMLVILAGHWNMINAGFYNYYHFTFCMESIAVMSFGFSWLTKAELWFKD